MKLILDIETIPLTEQEILTVRGPFDRASAKPPGNYSKQESIDKWTTEQEAAWGKPESAALNPLYSKCAIIGIASLNVEAWMDKGADKLIIDQSIEHELSEAAMLVDAWSAITEAEVIAGYNIHGFDLPFLISRSIINGVAVPKGIRKGRYFADKFVDLADSFRRDGKIPKLQEVLRACGLPIKSGSGADFERLWSEDKDAALAYNEQDLRCEYALAQRIGVL